MSFMKTLRRAFGFSSQTDDEILLADSPEAAADVEPAAASGVVPSADQPAQFDQAKADAIFAKVVEIFNSSLPDFLSRSVDADVQRRLLREALDQDIQAYINSLAAEANARSEAGWQQRQNGLASELEAVRRKADEVEKKSADFHQKQLSADRQKRALTDRVHDLEAHLARLEAEREQFELENRSLLNRIKVADVQSRDIDGFKAEIQRLTDENRQLRLDPSAALQPEIDKAKEELTQTSEQLSQAKVELTQARAEADAAKATIEEMTAGIDALKEQIRVSKDMHDDMRARVAERDKKLTARDKKIEELKATIAENLRTQAEREKALKNEIESLRPRSEMLDLRADFEPVREDHAPRISEDELTAIEATFENGEWFTKTPPPETPSMRPPEREGDFGYQPPQKRKHQPSNPGQLSLF